MKIEKLSDSETTRNTYDKNIESFTKKPVFNTTTFHQKKYILKDDLGKETIEDESSD